MTVTLDELEAAMVARLLREYRNCGEVQDEALVGEIDEALGWLTRAQQEPAKQPNVEPRFPIQGGPSVPWSVMLPHEDQCRRNHGQSLAQIAQRGGFSPSEAYAVIHGIPYGDIRPEFRERWFTLAERVNRPSPEPVPLATATIEDVLNAELDAQPAPAACQHRELLMKAARSIRGVCRQPNDSREYWFAQSTADAIDAALAQPCAAPGEVCSVCVWARRRKAALQFVDVRRAKGGDGR